MRRKILSKKRIVSEYTTTALGTCCYTVVEWLFSFIFYIYQNVHKDLNVKTSFLLFRCKTFFYYYIGTVHYLKYQN